MRPGSDVAITADTLSAFEVCVIVSEESHPAGADGFITATAHDWPDALGGSALAGVLDAPILYASTNSVPDVVVRDEVAQILQQVREIAGLHEPV